MTARETGGYPPGRTESASVALTGYGLYVPDERLTGREIASRSGVPESVVTEKMGVREKRVCPPDDDHVTDMCVKAGMAALADASVDADDVDVVLYHGSEYKDYVVWSAAANVAERIGAENAFANESYALCAGAPLAFRQAKATLLADHVETVLLVAASREADLVEYDDADASFMFNFGSGASAAVLERVERTDDSAASDKRTDGVRATVLESAALTDGSFSEDVVMPAGGSRHPPDAETVQRGMHALTVPDPDGMKRRLAPVSLPSYLEVADTALERSGHSREDLDFVAVTHMKRSFHERLLAELGLDAADSYYLDEYGHVQSVDQLLALDEGLADGRVEPGDIVCLLAAGTGYTWAATVLEWRG